MILNNKIAIVPLMLAVLVAGLGVRAEGSAVGHNEVIDTFLSGTAPAEGMVLHFDPSGASTNSYWPHLGSNAPSLAFVAYPGQLYLYERSANLLSGSWTAWAGYNNLYGSEHLAVKTGIDAGESSAFFRIVRAEGGASATVPPPQYETSKPPAAGEWFTDPVFGTRIKRLTDEQNIYGWNGERAMFSADDKYFAIAVNAPFKLRLFDGRTGDFIRDLPVSRKDNSEFRWSYDPQVLVYPKDNRLMSYNVVTDQETILAEFAENIGNKKGRLCGGDGNDFDDRGEWLMINFGPRMFAYNIRTGETGPEKDMSSYGLDYCSISPSGQYIVGTGKSTGKLIWNRDWTNERQLLTGNAHMDMGYLNGTEECLIAKGAGGILGVRFSDLAQFLILEGSGLGIIQFSAVGGSNRHSVYLAAESKGLDPNVEWGCYQGELVQVPLATTGPGPIRRLAHHRARTTDGSFHNFEDQPEAWINHAGDRLFFRSNMDNYNQEGKHDLYMIELEPPVIPPAAITTLVEQWTFDGANPETGTNGTIISTWTTNAPNSVVTNGVLRVVNTTDSDWGNSQLLPDIDTSAIDKMIWTIECADLKVSAGSTFRFSTLTSAGGDVRPELELTSWGNGPDYTFSPDMEYYGATDDLGGSNISLTGSQLGGPLTIVATWDFANNNMSMQVGSNPLVSITPTANMVDTIGTITGFRMYPRDIAAGDYLDLDSVTIETTVLP